MKKGGGRAKGHGFERAIAKMIAIAFSGCGIKQKDVYRTPMSGGHFYASKKDPGDLQMSKRLQKLFPFVVECKFYGKINLHRLFDGVENDAKLCGWLKQATKAWKNSGGWKRLTPVVVFKQNHDKPLVLLPIETKNLSHVWWLKKIKRKFTSSFQGSEYVVIRFSTMLKVIAKWNKEMRDGVQDKQRD